jgi:ATP/maltotriose-dependent transcriptional regulator MalT
MNAFCSASQPLLEREQCLVDLQQWLSAANSCGCIALVCGEAGIGKTALVHEFAQRQRARRVLWGACDALFTPRPLAPLQDMARQTKGVLLDAINSGTHREVIFNATLDELARGTPALVVFEDMHWADEATLDLLKFLGRRINRTRAMMVVTYRDDEVGPRHPLRFVMGDLPRTHCHRLALSPLSELAVAKLARQAGRSCASLHSVTGGNPFFVTEVLAANAATEKFAHAAGAATVPVSVRDAVLARTVRLSPAAREIAELVCVIPGKTEIWLLQGAMEPDEAAIESCLRIGMTRDEDGSLAFRHELARRALEDSLCEARRQCLHAKVLGILTPRAGVSAARLAYHADGSRNVEALLRYAPIAAAQTALRLYLLACSARSKLEQGDWEGSSEDLDAVLRHPSATATTRIVALTVLALLRIRRGDPDPGSPLREARVLAGPLQELPRLAALAAAHAEAAWLAGDREDVICAVRPIYDLARHKPDPRMNGELAVWLHRADALDEESLDAGSTQFAQPYAMEIAGEWRAAANTWKDLGCPYEQASLLALHGNEIEKREALEIFERLGASPASRALRKQFRADGVKGVPRGARASTQSNQHGLTKREAEVLGLLSQGMRNAAIAKRLFVSQKTVDHHVSAILTKLGVPSRGEAVVVTSRGR